MAFSFPRRGKKNPRPSLVSLFGNIFKSVINLGCYLNKKSKCLEFEFLCYFKLYYLSYSASFYKGRLLTYIWPLRKFTTHLTVRSHRDACFPFSLLTFLTHLSQHILDSIGASTQHCYPREHVSLGQAYQGYHGAGKRTLMMTK